MRKRSRLSLVVLTIVMALVLSSCWQIRLIKADKWLLSPGEIAKLTVDLYPSHPDLDITAYPIVLIGFDANLVNKGRFFDAQNNYGGKEPGVKSANLKNHALNSDDCAIGATSLQDIKGAYDNWLGFRTTNTISILTASQTDPLRFRWKTSPSATATGGGVGAFAVFSGMWSDGNTNGSVDEDELICMSFFTGTFTFES